MTHALLGEYEESITDYNHIISSKAKDIDMIEIYQLRGEGYYNAKKLGLAVKDFSEVIKVNPITLLPILIEGTPIIG